MPSRPTTLLARATLISGLCLFAAVVAAVTALMIRTRLVENLDQTSVLATAARNHAALDRHHHELHAVVMSALTAGEFGTPEQDIRARLDRMSGAYGKAVDANKPLPLSPEIEKLPARADAPFAAYVEQAKTIVNHAFKDRGRALAEMPAFAKSFDDLDGALEAAGEKIENDAKTHATQSAAFAATTSWIANAAVAFSIGCVLLTVYFMMRAVVRPISTLEQAMVRLSKGERASDLPETGRSDEIGSMARALSVFAHGIEENERMRQERADAEHQMSEARRAARQNLARDFESTVGAIIDKVALAAGSLESTAKTLARSAEATQQLSVMVGTASEVTSSNVTSVATATEQLSGAVSEIERQVSQTASAATQAVDKANATNARVGELLEAANRIGNVVGLINSIASQTNLLALNATIEAARAGEAGKGFAVVAQEVKALATQTAKATSDIARQIQDMQTATKDAVDAIGGVVDTIGKISDISNAISAAVAEQATATQDISHNVQEAANGTSQVTANIVEVNASAADTGNASTNVLSSAAALAADGGALKAEVARFLGHLRAA